LSSVPNALSVKTRKQPADPHGSAIYTIFASYTPEARY
jgi:hypothetical protein